jgi:undecaprenyl-diphosphatase
MKARAFAIAAGAVAFAACLALGFAVDRFGEPAPLWAFDRAVVGHGAIAAWYVTQLGRAYVLLPLGIALAILAVALSAWRWRIATSIALLLFSWRAAALLQHVFARPRRLDWVIFHETSFSFPSSHAAIVVGFYAFWAWTLAQSLPRPWSAASAAALSLVCIAILWSRLALGAHYATDIAGGALLGFSLLCAAYAVWPEIAARGRRSAA